MPSAENQTKPSHLEPEKRLCAWNYSSHIEEAGQRGCCPFPPCTPNPPLTQPPLRSGQILLDHSEHLLHNHHTSVATLRLLFTFAPECRSASLRNRCSPSPEYPGSEPLCYDFVLDRPVRRGQEASMRRQPSPRHPTLLQPRIHFRGKGPGCGSKIRPVQRDGEKSRQRISSDTTTTFHQLLDVDAVCRNSLEVQNTWRTRRSVSSKSLDQNVARSGRVLHH